MLLKTTKWRLSSHNTKKRPFCSAAPAGRVAGRVGAMLGLGELTLHYAPRTCKFAVELNGPQLLPADFGVAGAGQVLFYYQPMGQYTDAPEDNLLGLTDRRLLDEAEAEGVISFADLRFAPKTTFTTYPKTLNLR